MSRGHSPIPVIIGSNINTTSGQHQQQPPPPPPKDHYRLSQQQLQSNDYNYHHHQQQHHRNNTSIEDANLAAALRDSVQISSTSKSASTSTSTNISNKSSSNPLKANIERGSISIPRRTPSPLPLPLPSSNSNSNFNSNYNKSKQGYQTHVKSSSMTSTSTSTSTTEIDFSRHQNHQQPMLPSAMISAKNPFEEDEIEPYGNGRIKPPVSASGGIGTGTGSGQGLGKPTRQKITRATTGNLPPSPPNSSTNNTTNYGHKTRPRRSMSSDSNPYGDNVPGIRELTSGQRKALENKKGSRHADVIDTWDPTGLGSAMWHHSGPYDAAAPSRNTHIPPSKAPMSAFQGQPILSPPKTTPTTISLANSSAPPAVPSKECEPRRVPPKASRRTSGGLTGQYSTSMPTSGGYFPDVNELQDEAAMARLERQKERDNKRRALKAAWGTDTPEPFEDFGGSPLDGMADLPEEDYSPDALPAKPMRSPGLRLGSFNNGGRTPPPVKEDPTSPINEYPVSGPISSGNAGTGRSYSYSSGSGAAGAGGVKRTKSLMQKIKTMREGNRRAASPKKNGNGLNSPTSEYPPVPALPNSPDTKSRPPFFTRPSDKTAYPSNPNRATTTAAPVSQENEEVFEDATDVLPSTGSGLPPNSVILNESDDIVTSSKSSPKSSRRHGQGQRAKSTNEDLLDDDLPDSHGQVTNTLPPFPVPVNRVKNLPTPPVGPVLPSFDDLLIARHNSRSPARDRDEIGTGSGSGSGNDGSGVRRKGSVVKKLKDRIVR